MKIKFLRSGIIFVLSASIMFFNAGGVKNDVKAETINTVTRLCGLNRYETAVKIASTYNSGTLQNVIIATGEDFPDSLSGNVFASKIKAPILLVGKDVSSSLTTLNYITSKLDKGGNIYLLGGNGAVGDDIVKYLQNNGYSKFTRLGGTDRFETNKAIENQLGTAKGTPVFLVTADNFPDALSISSIAAIKGWPIILTNSDGLSQSAKEMIADIAPSQVFLVGGEGVLKPQIKADIKALLPGLSDQSIIRLGGQDRYDTSAQVLKYFNLNTSNCVLATGENFPDGIAGGVLASKLNAPIILINDSSLSKQKLVIDSANPTYLTILGGTGVVSSNVENRLQKVAGEVYGFDCASKPSFSQYQQLKAVGYSFVARYYCQSNSVVDPLTNQEAKDITNAGLKVMSVFENGYADRVSYFSYAQGISDAASAIASAKNVGQPSDTPIYFAIDYDTTVNNNDFTGIDAYFAGIKKYMNDNGNQYKIGVYGSNTAVDHVYNKLGADTYIWQTHAWSTVRNSKCNVYQYQDNLLECGVYIDKDVITNANVNNWGIFTVY